MFWRTDDEIIRILVIALPCLSLALPFIVFTSFSSEPSQGSIIAHARDRPGATHFRGRGVAAQLHKRLVRRGGSQCCK